MSRRDTGFGDTEIDAKEVAIGATRGMVPQKSKGSSEISSKKDKRISTK